MRPAAALTVLSCLLLVGCGGSDESDGSTEPGAGATLEELWRAPGDDVAVIPGTENHEPGDVRVSFLVVDAEGASSRFRPRASGSRTRSTRRRSSRTRRSSSASAFPAATRRTRRTSTSRTFRCPAGEVLAARRAGGGRREGAGARERRRRREDDAAGRRRPGDRFRHADAVVDRRGHVEPDDAHAARRVAAALLGRDSLEAKVPFVVTFATPKFCSSRTCGPVVDVVEEVSASLRGRERALHPRRGLRGQRPGEGLQPLDAGVEPPDGAVDVPRRRRRQDRRALRGHGLGERARGRPCARSWRREPQ